MKRGQVGDAAKFGWSESFYWRLKVIGDWVCSIGTIWVPVAIQQVPQVSIWYPVSLADEQIQLASWKIAGEILDGFIISKIDPCGFVWKHYPQVHCLVTMFPTTIAPCSDTSWHIMIHSNIILLLVVYIILVNHKASHSHYINYIWFNPINFHYNPMIIPLNHIKLVAKLTWQGDTQKLTRYPSASRTKRGIQDLRRCTGATWPESWCHFSGLRRSRDCCGGKSF